MEGKEIHDLPSEQPADKGYTGADFDDPNNIRPTPRGATHLPRPAAGYDSFRPVTTDAGAKRVCDVVLSSGIELPPETGNRRTYVSKRGRTEIQPTRRERTAAPTAAGSLHLY
jgi:hypothetical protein